MIQGIIIFWSRPYPVRSSLKYHPEKNEKNTNYFIIAVCTHLFGQLVDDSSSSADIRWVLEIRASSREHDPVDFSHNFPDNKIIYDLRLLITMLCHIIILLLHLPITKLRQKIIVNNMPTTCNKKCPHVWKQVRPPLLSPPELSRSFQKQHNLCYFPLKCYYGRPSASKLLWLDGGCIAPKPETFQLVIVKPTVPF